MADNWPQDRVKVPDGRGQMPPIGDYNRALVRREAFTLAMQSADLTYGATPVSSSVIIPIPDWGDFWLASIGIRIFNVTSGNVVTGANARLQLRDIRNDYRLMHPQPAEMSYFRVVQEGRMVNFMQPYCFTRTGGVEITFTQPAKSQVTTNRYYIALNGWLEYEHASK